MTIFSAQVSVDGTAVRLDPPTSHGSGHWFGTVTNRGSAGVYLGKSDVDSAKGRLNPGESISLDLIAEDRGLYALAASGTQTLDVIGVGRA